MFLFNNFFEVISDILATRLRQAKGIGPDYNHFNYHYNTLRKEIAKVNSTLAD